MKRTLLLTISSLVFLGPQAFAASELENLRTRCAEQENQIRQLEEDIAKLRSLNELSAKSRQVQSHALPVGPPAPADKSAPASDRAASVGSYTVRFGDCLEKIARSCGTDTVTLANLNGLKADAIIREGQKIKIPTEPASPPVATTRPPKPAAAAAPDTGKTHRVKDGETLYAISRQYGLSTAKLISANPGIKPTALRPGMEIQLPESSKPKKSAKPAEAPVAAPATAAPSASNANVSTPTAAHAIHTVTISGSTTYGEFAAKHGTNVGRLNDLNALELAEATVLAKGSELYVPAQPQARKKPGS